MTSNYYHDACGAMLVYCVEDIYTFENLQEYIEQASLYVNMNTFVWALLGNKADLSCEEVEEDRIEAQCKELQTNLSYSVSAKTGQNITKAFNDLITTIHKTQQCRQRKSTICVENANSTAATNKRKSCC